MSAKISDFLGFNYGWSYGEDNWNTGMDANLLQSSYLHDATIKGVVSNLPSMVSGDAYFNTLDNKVYYCVNSIVYSTEIPVNKVLYDTIAQIQYIFNGTTLEAVDYITQDDGDLRYILKSSAGATGTQVLAAATPAAGRTALGLGTASTQPSSAFEPAITAGTTAQYIRGDKSLATFATDVIASILTGLSTASSAVISASDTVLSALGKLQAQVSLRAPLASPSLTGTPLAPTAPAGTSTLQIATTAFVTAADTLKANLASPNFTGTPTAPTAAQGANSTQLATTAYVDTLGGTKAPTASPALTGTPTAPTAAAGTNTTQIATTAFVLANASTNTNNYLQVQDQKALGTAGGAGVNGTTATSFTRRTLNTSVINQIAGASLTGDILTLPAGTFYLECFSILGTNSTAQNGKFQIWNETTSAQILESLHHRNTSSPDGNIVLPMSGMFTLSASQGISLRYNITSGAATTSLGNSAGKGSVEIYSDIRIWKLS